MRSRLCLAALLASVGCGTRSEPSLITIEPQVVCDAGATIRIAGADLGATVDIGDDPTFRTASVSLLRVASATGEPVAARSIVVPPEATRWIDAATMEIDVGPDLGLIGGAWDVTVTNPDGGAATAGAALVVLDPPVLDGVSPEALCEDAPAVALRVRGEGFLRGADASPEVWLGGSPVPVVAMDDCAPLLNGAGALCRTLTITGDGTAHMLGDAPIALVNPAPAACAAIGAATVSVAPAATVDAVEPEAVCVTDGRFTLRGAGFAEGTGVSVGGVPAEVVRLDEHTLDVRLGSGTPLGRQDVVVDSGGCPVHLPQALRVTSGSEIFFVDPPVVYAGIDVVITAWMADAGGAVTDVRLVAPDGSERALAFSSVDAGVVQATVPAGLVAGSYGLRVDRADGCGGGLDDAVAVADTLTVAVDRVEPSHAWTWDHTPVEVYATDPPPADAVGFADSPRVYLTPRDPSGSAATVWGITFRDPSRLTAVVPYGLEPGSYDVLVVNPDGAIGLLEGGVEITLDSPPEIASVSPPSLPNSADTTVTIRGSELRDPTVQVHCDEAGVVRTLPAPVTRWTGTIVEAVVPATAFGQAICVVEVTNADGTSARYAAISIRNPAENLFPWSPGTDMVEGRRAPAAVAARTTSVSRYVYALGGDDGAPSGARSSVERAPVGVYGEMGAWELLPTGLPAPRTLAVAARIGSFVYLVGGNDGSAPLASVWRAHVLDPRDVPHLERLYLDTGAALAPGRWIWRVAALYDAADETDPGGESLPGEPVVVTLTSAAQVTLGWTPVPRAVGYRVYRSPAADADDVEWLADVVGAEYTDVGDPTDPGRRPLADGALGQWAPMPTMVSARQSPCLAVAPDPHPDPEKVYLYVAGGLDAAGRPLDTIEYLDVDVLAPDRHRVGSWTPSRHALSEARYECGGYAVDSTLHSVVAEGESWVYFAGGRNPSRTTGAAETGRVASGGDLDPFLPIESMSPTRAGFGVASASDFLYVFGGHHGLPSSTGASAELEAVTMPDVWNWNALGGGVPRPRYLMGSAQESAVLFVVGGTTETAAATRTTDVTHY